MKSIYKLIGILLITSSFMLLSASYTAKKQTLSQLNYSWIETDSSLALYHQKNILWQYNFKTQKGKPFFHPININNTTLTELSPKDHPWHLGIWHSWKYINGINYWEYDQIENSSPWYYKGQTTIKSISIKKNPDLSCEISLTINYHEGNKPIVLNENRIITISSPDKNQLFSVDYDFEFTALENLLLDRTPLPNEQNGADWGGYAGLSIRFNTNLKPWQYINSNHTSNLNHGDSGTWRYYGLETDTKNIIGASIFDHLDSFNHPTPWYITNSLGEDSLYYLGTAPLFNKLQHLLKGEQLKFKHRIQFYSGNTNFSQIETDWKSYNKKE